MKTINAILVDDHELFRLGVRHGITNRYPEIKLVGEAETGAGFFRLLETTTADIVLLDIDLPDMRGTEIASRLREERPELKILAVSAENSTAVVQEMIDIGIDGFISKRAGGIDILGEAVLSIMHGLEYFGKDISDIIYQIYVSKKKTAEITPEFTDRERQIIELCREGLRAKEIADRLCISIRTVDNYKNNIFRKLGINGTIEMVNYALKNGIIKVSD
jgi:DNA-binding NarL/FixJ family response regulator